MKKTFLALAFIGTAAGSFLAGRQSLSAYVAELDYMNSLPSVEIIENLMDGDAGAINRAVLERMDPRELIGAAFDALTDEGADEDDLSGIIAEVREGKQN